MNELDILCTCGHTEAQHTHKPCVSGKGCGVKHIKNGMETFVDGCFKYVPDNLTHIEQLAKQKGLV